MLIVEFRMWVLLQVAGGSRIENGEYPERVGEPTCEVVSC